MNTYFMQLLYSTYFLIVAPFNISVSAVTLQSQKQHLHGKTTFPLSYW